MKYLSLGRQEFSNLINENLIYVDKTEYIFRLITEGRAYFLSRPRRFGKSLLVNTLKEIFLGNQHYFKDLWIENKIEWKKYPVIQLDFSSMSYREQPLQIAIQKKLQSCADSYEITLKGQDSKEMFENLITQLFEQTQQQVVILIDEYDKPIIDYLHDIPQAEENREVLKNLYSTLKPTDKYLKFVFITGVSKFAKVSIFSDLNHLTDITLDKHYAKMLGYTQNELEFYFADKLKSAATSLELTEKELLEKVKYWYNGYSWDAKSTVYNPFSVQNFLLQEKFSNFWFSTGTPTFLTKILHEDFNYNLKNIEAGSESFDTHKLDKLNIIALLFQTGYLTIKEDLGFGIYLLDYPNLEVRDSLSRFMISDLANQDVGNIHPLVFRLYRALKKADFEEFFDIFKTLFASIPYAIFIANSENYYNSIIFLTLNLLGFFVKSEVMHNKGRLDIIVEFDDKIIIIEFKLDKSAQIALQQIKDKGYANPFLQAQKTIYLIGVNLKKEEKNIGEYIVEIL